MKFLLRRLNQWISPGLAISLTTVAIWCFAACQLAPPHKNGSDGSDASGTVDGFGRVDAFGRVDGDGATDDVFTSADAGGITDDAARGWDVDQGDVELPILERSVDPVHSCVASPPHWGAFGDSRFAELTLGSLNGDSYLITQERIQESYQLRLNRVLADGTSQNLVILAQTDEATQYHPAAVEGTDGLVLVWSQEGYIYLATVDAWGDWILQPTPVPCTQGEHVSSPQLVITETGFALGWISGQHLNRTLQMVLLDRQGACLETPLNLSTNSPLGYDMASSSQGLAMVWSDQNEENIYSISFALYTGPSSTTHHTLVSPLHMNAVGPKVLALGDGFLVAFTESNVDHLLQRGYRNGWVTRLDSTGQVEQAPVPLATTEVHKSYEVSQVTDVGEHLALFWTQSDIIYFCAGCIYNDQGGFIYLAKDDLTPISDTVIFGGGGTNALQAVSNGSHWLVGFLYSPMHAYNSANMCTVTCN